MPATVLAEAYLIRVNLRRVFLSNARALFRFADNCRHHIAIFCEGVVDNLQRGNRVGTERERLGIEASEARFMDPTAAATWRRTAQVLKEA